MEVGTRDRSVSGRGIAHAKSDSLVHGGDFSRTDSIIIHRLHRRRVLIIRLGRARRMDRESALWKKKHTGESWLEIGHACAQSSADERSPPTRGAWIPKCIFPVLAMCEITRYPWILEDFLSLSLIGKNEQKKSSQADYFA